MFFGIYFQVISATLNCGFLSIGFSHTLSTVLPKELVFTLMPFHMRRERMHVVR